MDYLHYRYKNWEPFEYMKMSSAKKRVARQYMKMEMEDRNKRDEGIMHMFGGGT